MTKREFDHTETPKIKLMYCIRKLMVEVVYAHFTITLDHMQL